MTTHREIWELAESIQLTPASALLDPEHDGVVTARPHPTGWFISARHATGLSAARKQDFLEFVRVRTFLLLEYGPQQSKWEADGTGGWQTYCVGSRFTEPQTLVV